MPKEELTARLLELLERMPFQRTPAGFECPPDVELTMPQFRVLALLSRGPRRMSEIATFLGVALSSATGMVDRLVDRGLAARSHDRADRRVVTCRLTERGSRAFQQHWQIGRSHIEQTAKLLKEHELRKVVEAMEILAAAFQREAAKT